MAAHLKDLGIDMIDVSSGALTPKARIPVGKGYQVQFARRIRDEAGIMTGAVGLITEAAYANEVITGGDADLVFIARELLREPYWALKAQSELGEDPSWPTQYWIRREATGEVARGPSDDSKTFGASRRTAISRVCWITRSNSEQPSAHSDGRGKVVRRFDGYLSAKPSRQCGSFASESRINIAVWLPLFF